MVAWICSRGASISGVYWPKRRRFSEALLGHSQPVDLDLEKMVDAGSVDAVRFDRSLGLRVNDLAVDDEVRFVRAHANLERVGRFSVGFRLLDGVAGGFRAHV